MVKHFSLKPRTRKPIFILTFRTSGQCSKIRNKHNRKKGKKEFTMVVLKNIFIKLKICHDVGEKTNNKNIFSKKHILLLLIAILLTIFGNINKIINFI